MSASEKTILRLKDKIKRLKLEVAALKSLPKKIERTEKQYNSSQKKFKTVFNQSSLGHKFIDADLKIISVNKALVKLLGYSKKELLGSRITDLVVPEFATYWKELQHQLWTNKKPSFSIDTCLIKKNKSVIWCHVTSILIEDNGERLGYTILENITARKRMELAMKEASDRERLFEQKLLELTINTQEQERARIAEDLHNSLGQLLYGVKLNLDQLQMDSSALIKQNVLIVENTTNLLTECIKETRRISHDLMPSVLQDFGLKMAIEDICNQLGQTLHLKYEFTGSDKWLPQHLEKAVYRMVQELAMNMIKHAAATKASIKLVINKKDIVLRVMDNGIGFNVKNMDKDVGIGLSSIKTKLHLLKGELDISSKQGKGTVINIRLPSQLAEGS